MNIFQMKAKPHGHEKLEEFLSQDYICIGWPGIGNLSDVSKDEIRERLENKYQETGHKLGYSLGQVNGFVNTMEKNDVVLVKDKEMVHVGIVGEYEYKAEFDNDTDGVCHRRSVEWKEIVPFSKLNNDIQGFVNNRHTISQFPKPIESEDIEELLYKKESITQNEKEKLDSLFNQALDILQDELKSEDPERRLKAASELIKIKTSGGFGDEED